MKLLSLTYNTYLILIALSANQEDKNSPAGYNCTIHNNNTFTLENGNLC